MSSLTGQLKDDQRRAIAPPPAEVEGHEFLGVCVVLSLIYFLAPRPDLYWSVVTWLAEAAEVISGWVQAIL